MLFLFSELLFNVIARRLAINSNLNVCTFSHLFMIPDFSKHKGIILHEQMT